jgi:hypothetical protein
MAYLCVACRAVGVQMWKEAANIFRKNRQEMYSQLSRMLAIRLSTIRHKSQSQYQCYFTTSGLPKISSSWRQVP